MCSWCRISIDHPVWSTYELLHVLHFDLYKPLEFILFRGILSRSWLYMALLVQTAIFKLVLFNKLVTLCMSVLWYVKVTHFFVCCVCVGVTFVFCVLSITLFFSLWIICNGKPFFLAMARIIFHSCFFYCSVIDGVFILFMETVCSKFLFECMVGCEMYSSVCLCGLSVNT